MNVIYTYCYQFACHDKIITKRLCAYRSLLFTISLDIPSVTQTQQQQQQQHRSNKCCDESQ